SAADGRMTGRQLKMHAAASTPAKEAVATAPTTTRRRAVQHLPAAAADSNPSRGSAAHSGDARRLARTLAKLLLSAWERQQTEQSAEPPSDRPDLAEVAR